MKAAVLHRVNDPLSIEDFEMPAIGSDEVLIRVKACGVCHTDCKVIEGRIATLEATIAEREAAMKTLEATMSAPGFYDDHDASKPTIDRHQALMWELGDLMHRWEELQQELEAVR